MQDGMDFGPLVALYATQDDAAGARRRLIAGGVSPGAISVLNVAPPGEATHASPAPSELRGIWAKLKDFIGFERPKLSSLSGGLVPRQATLTVDPPAAARDTIVRMIRETEPQSFSVDALPDAGVDPAVAPTSDPSI